MMIAIDARIGSFELGVRVLCAKLAAFAPRGVSVDRPTRRAPVSRHRQSILVVWLGLVIAGLCLSALADDNHQANVRYFEQHVAPLIQQHCWDCHSHQAGEASGGLLLDSLASMQQGGTRGPAIVPGNSDASWIVRAIEYQDAEVQMPPDEQLPKEKIAAIRKWIEAGAVVPDAWKQPKEDAAHQRPVVSPKNHWAYQPPVDTVAQAWQQVQAQTTRQQQACIQTGIDALIAEQLLAHGIFFSEPADRATLFRRLSYDLRGLPPAEDELAEFVDDPRPTETVVGEAADRLLASPRMGERWARYWMDVARYADNKGYVFREDREYPEAYRYRDWLITAYNDDMPFDDFVRYQLAADLSADGDEHLPALGFVTLGRRFLNNKFDIVDDRLDVVSRGLMGLTLSCARCHDHKYDPVTQADYYALAGVFFNCEEPGGEPFAHRLKDAETIRPAFILLRGNPGSVGPRVPRRFVQFLAPDAEPFPEETSGRRELAEHIVSPDNPLTARVYVNRVWMHLMGEPLVDTPSDFGMRCPEPVQRRLLDHLALYLQRNGWSTKKLIRYIVTSYCYQQRSSRSAEAASVDPENRLYWRMNRRRLDFEALRDTLLARSGRLDLTMGGPSVRIDGMSYAPRRTVYAYIDRQNLPSMFRTFDFAGPDTHSPRRPRTTVPQQGLFMLNSPMVLDLADRLAARYRTMADRDGSPAAAKRMFELVLGRSPEPTELQWMVQFVQQATGSPMVNSQPLWQCGYGAFDPEQGTLRSFEPLPAFIDGGWRGGAELPDPQLGWCLLTARGGHVGNDLQHAVVRRWVAPRSGRVMISGQLAHRQAKGDGVRGSILVRGNLADQWVVHNQQTKTNVSGVDIQAGTTIDFVTDCRSSVSHDSFEWTVSIRYVDGSNETYDSQRQFPQPRPQPLDPWGQLAQVLLCANELAFLD